MRLKNQRGATTVEFAILAPLIFLILFGIIEFSILLYDKAMLTNASREGARVGIVFVPDRGTAPYTISALNTTIENAVDNYCAENLVSFSSSSEVDTTPVWHDCADITDVKSDPVSGECLTVTVTYDFNFLVFSNLIKLFGVNLNEIFNLKAVTVMRLE